MRLHVLVAVLAAVSCGVVVEPVEAPGRQSAALVGGTVDDGGFPQVVMLRTIFTNDAGVTQGFACSGTVITPRVVLTAAHCFNENGGPSGYSLTGVSVHNFNVAPPTNSPLWIPAAMWRRHPGWSSGAAMNFDIGLVQMAAPIADVTPTPYLNRSLLPADVTKPMAVVGYGITSSGGTGAGTRRFVTLPLRSLTTQHLQLGNMSTAGICNGDSGGPSFLTESDGVRRVAGVHSWTQPGGNCMDGLDTRVDLYGPFIRQFLMDTGGPACVEDGLCASGCPSADPDCVCIADGMCNGQCANLLSDPDCPRDCVADGVCSTQSCPRPDPDCRAELSACTADTQCQYRTCATDPQRNERYCSRPCTATCQMGTTCSSAVCLKPQLPTAVEGQPCTIAGTFCLAMTTCSGLPTGTLTCRRTCMTDTNCASTDECVAGQNAVRVCERKPPEAAAGEPCMIGITRCLGNTTCSGVTGAPTTCRATCTTDAQCASSDECVDGVNAVRICVRRPPPIMQGAACTPGAVSPRCIAGTTCSGLPGGATTCRATCITDAQCSTADECVDGSNSVRICVPRAPPVMLGAACTAGVSRCITPTACTGVPGGPTTCRATCMTNAQCDASDECVAGQGGLNVCVLRPPDAMKGGACTIGVTRCLGGTTCTGVPGDATTCLESCELESDCAPTEYCGRGQNDAGVCRPQPIFVEPIQIAESVAPKTGCASVPGGWAGLVALLLAMRRLSRRA
ncbi:MAG: trypsin-like serine protease [Myxococcales bacterium]|nr:trypsin-like serine protease [Myxococcales bacterium]